MLARAALLALYWVFDQQGQACMAGLEDVRRCFLGAEALWATLTLPKITSSSLPRTSPTTLGSLSHFIGRWTWRGSGPWVWPCTAAVPWAGNGCRPLHTEASSRHGKAGAAGCSSWACGVSHRVPCSLSGPLECLQKGVTCRALLADNLTLLSLSTVMYSVYHLPIGPLEEAR